MADSENNFEPETNEEIAIDPRKAIRQHLRALSQAGVQVLPHGQGRFDFRLLQTVDHAAADNPGSRAGESSPPPKPTAASQSKGVPPVANINEPGVSYQLESSPQATVIPAEDPYGPSLSLPNRQSTMDTIRTEVEACQRCPELCHSRKQTVFGAGKLNPRLVFVGEGPGADEDRMGEPFVGAAGRKLNKIIAACKMERSDVYILNTVKCRPPANRNPSQSELDQCWEYAQRQLEVLQPEFICCLGSVAAKRILNTGQSLGRLRQKFYPYRGSRVLVTYHPAYLLRTESANRLVWEDMKLLMKEMGIQY